VQLLRWVYYLQSVSNLAQRCLLISYFFPQIQKKTQSSLSDPVLLRRLIPKSIDYRLDSIFYIGEQLIMYVFYLLAIGGSWSLVHLLLKISCYANPM
jgi:hypothetical protein